MKKCGVGLVLLLACSCNGGGNMNGKIDGHSLTVAQALFAVGPSVYSDQVQALWIYLSSDGQRCSDFAANKARRNTSELGLTVFKVPDPNGTPTPPSAGSYNATDIVSIQSLSSAANVAWGNFSLTDSSCQSEYVGSASEKVEVTAGSITLKGFNATSGGTASGSYTLYVGSQNNKVTGSFDASYCAALANAFNTESTNIPGPGAPTCTD